LLIVTNSEKKRALASSESSSNSKRTKKDKSPKQTLRGVKQGPTKWAYRIAKMSMSNGQGRAVVRKMESYAEERAVGKTGNRERGERVSKGGLLRGSRDVGWPTKMGNNGWLSN